MSMETQGCQIRRQSTTAGTTAVIAAGAGLITFSTVQNGITRAVGDFAADGFVAGMRIFSNSTLYNNIYTVKTVQAATMLLYETLSTSTGSTAFTVEGHPFQTIGGVTGFNGPTGSAAVIDITAISDTAAKQKMVGIRDEGQITLDINFSSSSTDLHEALRNDRANRSVRNFDMKFTDQTTNSSSQPSAMVFSGYVTGYALTGAVDQVVKASLTLELTSAIKYIAQVPS